MSPARQTLERRLPTNPVALAFMGYRYILHVTLTASWAIPPSIPIDSFSREAIEEPSLEGTQGATSPLGAAITSRRSRKPNSLFAENNPQPLNNGFSSPLQQRTTSLQTWGCHLLPGAEDPPTPLGYTPVMFFFPPPPASLIVKMARSFVYLFNESWVSHKHKELGFRKESQQIARLMKETHDLATLQLYTGIFGFKESGLQKTHVLRNTVLENRLQTQHKANQLSSKTPKYHPFWLSPSPHKNPEELNAVA